MIVSAEGMQTGIHVICFVILPIKTTYFPLTSIGTSNHLKKGTLEPSAAIPGSDASSIGNRRESTAGCQITAEVTISSFQTVVPKVFHLHGNEMKKLLLCSRSSGGSRNAGVFRGGHIESNSLLQDGESHDALHVEANASSGSRNDTVDMRD